MGKTNLNILKFMKWGRIANFKANKIRQNVYETTVSD